LSKEDLSFQIIYGLVSLKVGEYAIGHFNLSLEQKNFFMRNF